MKAQSQAPTRKPKMPWTAARTTKCQFEAVSASLVCHAVTVAIAVRNRVTKTMSVAPLLGTGKFSQFLDFKVLSTAYV